MPDRLGKREIGLPSAGVKTNKLITNDVRTRGFVLVYPCIMEYRLRPWLKT